MKRTTYVSVLVSCLVFAAGCGAVDQEGMSEMRAPREREINNETSMGEDNNMVSSSLWAPKIGFYVIDGTTKTSADRTIMWQMFERYQGAVRGYQKGTDLLAVNADDLVLGFVSTICNDYVSRRIDGFAVAGYSRGAVMALEAAHKILGSSTFVPCTVSGKKPPFYWAGMLDAVDTSIYHMRKDVPAGLRLIHRVKFDEWDWLFTTVNFTGHHFKSRAAKGINHHQIGNDLDSLYYLINDAQNNMPGMSFW